MTGAPTRRRSLPDGMRVETVAMRDGWPVRRLHRDASGPSPGSILFVNGRGDFAEKYAETYHDWTDAGWGFATFDHRGQGGSGRFLADRQKGHAPGFDLWRGDLAEHAAWFKARFPAPHYAVAHSMGGHLMLRHLEANPGSFDRAVLLSPMCGLAARPVGPWLARLIARLACSLGFAESFAPGGGPLKRDPDGLRASLLTHDAERYSDEAWWIDHAPALEIGGVTNGWIASAFASIDALHAPGVVEGVTLPLIVLAAGNEGLVDNAATARAVARIPGATMEIFANAGHELIREVDPVRDAALGRIAAFFA